MIMRSRIAVPVCRHGGSVICRRCEAEASEKRRWHVDQIIIVQTPIQPHDSNFSVATRGNRVLDQLRQCIVTLAPCTIASRTEEVVLHVDDHQRGLLRINCHRCGCGLDRDSWLRGSIRGSLTCQVEPSTGVVRPGIFTSADGGPAMPIFVWTVACHAANI